MRYIRFATVVFLVLVGVEQGAVAQERGGQQGQISGVVEDADTGDPLASATIAVWNAADSSLVTGAVTTGDGRFALEGLRPGRYYVNVSFVGFRTHTLSDVELRPPSMQVDFGTIALVPDAAVLDEVEVVADREFIEVGIDKTVYNTKDQLVSAGGSASDVLQDIPSVEVDIDGNVSLRGSQNVAILINGRPSPMTGEALVTFLQGLPSDAIERVEVIPNPSARYEPDGMSGILNIVLAKDRGLGLGGSLTAGVGTQGRYNASGTLNFQQGRWTMFTNYGFRSGTRDIRGDRFRENRFLDPITYLEQDNVGEGSSLSHTLNTSVDYQLSAQNTLSLSAILSQRGGENEGVNAYREMDTDQTLTGRYDRLSNGDRSDLNMDYRLAFKRTVKPAEHELTAELRFEAEREDDESLYTEQLFTTADGEPANDTPELQRNDQEERTREGSFQVDYIRPLTEQGKLELGYKGSLQRLDSDFYSESFDYSQSAFVPDANLNNEFTYDEQVHAAYGIAEQEVGRFGAQVGVRVEQALTDFTLQTTDEAFANDYFSIFPSAFVTYALSNNQQSSSTLKFSYSKRINRPNMWQLNPFDDFEDPLFRRQGNPHLNPEYTHAFEASYTQFVQAMSFTVTPYFRRTVDVIRWHEFVNDTGVSIVTFENFDTQDSWGAEAIGTLRLQRWLNAYASFNAFKVTTDGSNVDSDLSNNAFGWMTRANATLKLQPDLSLQFSYFYRAPMDIENGRIGARSMSNVALQQKLLGDKASLSLSVRDVFGTMGFNVRRDDEQFFQTFNRRWDARQVGLTFTYNFGHEQRKQRGRPDRDNEGGGGYDDMPME